MTGWPFWAATSDERIDRAFDLAGLRAGEHLFDLGCGDGRVLLRAAALRRALVTGVELDAGLAARARALLTDHDIEGDVIEADFETVDLSAADVVFAYLSPATLQRLRNRLGALDAGTRIVTTGYAIPGWDPIEAGGRCFLYCLPATPTAPDPSAPVGWKGSGLLVAVHADAPSLVSVPLRHPGGAVTVGTDDPTATLSTRAGADTAGPGDELVVDLRFAPRPQSWTGTATVWARGVDSTFEVFTVVDDGEPGMWSLGSDGCRQVEAAIEEGRTAAMLAAARTTNPA